MELGGERAEEEEKIFVDENGNPIHAEEVEELDEITDADKIK